MLGRVKQEDFEFEFKANLGCLVRSGLQQVKERE
jgi:hypothetical protein